MRLASESNNTSDSLKVAVLAALNLADEIFRHRVEKDGRAVALAARAGEIERIVDAVLASETRLR
jgi:hypothetical protein